MICGLVLLALIALAGAAASSGHGVVDSRDSRYSLVLRPGTPRSRALRRRTP